jgi:hypothetical protein
MLWVLLAICLTSERGEMRDELKFQARKLVNHSIGVMGALWTVIELDLTLTQGCQSQVRSFNNNSQGRAFFSKWQGDVS